MTRSDNDMRDWQIVISENQAPFKILRLRPGYYDVLGHRGNKYKCAGIITGCRKKQND